MKVTLDGNILADSEETIVVEGNHYFPPDSVKTDLLKDSTTQYVYEWYKGFKPNLTTVL